MSLLNPGDGPSPFTFCLNKGANSKLFKKFKGFVRKRRLLDGSNSILVALSGGPDSVCLLHLLYLLCKRQGLSLQAAHFHHGLRGREADRDASFSEQLCKENAIPFYMERGDVRAYCKEKGMGIQDGARLLRYDFFKRLMAQKKIDVTATGHTASDQAEEVIFRLIRGSSLEGLSGIRPKRPDGFIRPLLFANKEEIIEHLRLMNIPYVTDSSNLGNKYTRNRLRHSLLPIIKKEFNPSIAETLSRSALLLQDDEDFLMSNATELFASCVTFIKGEDERLDSVPPFCVTFKRKRLSQAHPSVLRRVLLLGLERLGLYRSKIVSDHLLRMEEIVRSNNPSGLYMLPEGLLAIRAYERFLIIKKAHLDMLKGQGQQMPLTVKAPSTVKIGGLAGSLEFRPVFGKVTMSLATKEQSFPKRLFVDRNSCSFPLSIRFRRPGDRFTPFGSKSPIKLKDFMIAKRIPRIFRDSIPLVLKGEEIVAVCGIEVNEHFKVKKDAALEMAWKPHDLVQALIFP